MSSSKYSLVGLPAELRLNIYRYLGFPIDSKISKHQLPSETAGQKNPHKDLCLAWEMDNIVACSRYTLVDETEKNQTTSTIQSAKGVQYNTSGVQCCAALMRASRFFADELHQFLYEKSKLTVSTDAFRKLTNIFSEEYYVPGPRPQFLEISKAYCLRYVRHLCLEQGTVTYLKARPGMPLGKRIRETTLSRFCDSIVCLAQACPSLQTLELDPGSIDIYQLSPQARKAFAINLTASVLQLNTLEKLIWVPIGGPLDQSPKDTTQLSDKPHERREQIRCWIDNRICRMIMDCRYQCLRFDLDSIQSRTFGNLGCGWTGTLLAHILEYTVALHDCEGHIELIDSETKKRVKSMANMEMGYFCRILGMSGDYYMC